MANRMSTPSRDISLHFLENEAVLFDRRRQRLYAANTSAALIWCCLQENMRPSDIAALLVDRFRLDSVTADQYVDEAVRQWQISALLDEDPPSVAPSPFEVDRPHSALVPLRTDPAMARHYQVLDSIFTLRFSTKYLLRRVDPVLAHLSVPPPPDGGPEFDCRKLSHGYVLSEKERILLRCDRASQTAAMVKATLLQQALQNCDGFCAVHAGAVRRGNGCLLLPGSPGAGKSTLVAGLVSEGFELLGDDTVTLTRDDLLARPIPFGICVKKDAWALLSVRFPDLERSAVHDRPDGKSVRYLLPPQFPFVDPSDRIPVNWIVFPQFNAGSDTTLHPISKNNALRRLADHFVPLRADLESADVERLVKWIAGVPCYRLTMSSLTDAVRLLGHLCR